jgi:SAM-dependent methyltransferase
MLERAQLRQGLDGRIEWSVADAQKLDFPDEVFDCVCCQFGAMFFPDRTGAYAEARRVLKPGAPFIFSVWDSLAHNDLTRTVWDAVTAHYPENPPQFFHRKPHGHFDKAVIRRDLEAAGFADISIDIVTRESRARSARDVAVALVQGTPLRMELAVRDPDGLATVTDVAEAAVLRTYGAAEVAGKIQALVIEARD